MKYIKITALLTASLSLSACADALLSTIEGGERTGSERSFDAGRDAKHLSQLVAGVWVDPNGCDHWIIDDSVKGYFSQRLDKYGKLVCSGIAEPNTATGLFKSGSTFGDPI